MEFRDGNLHIGGVSVLDIVSRFGTPVYVYDSADIAGRIANVKRAFGALPFRPFYAMKANGNLAILRLIREHGFGCDAVSPGEIHLAQHAGYTPDEIWFTCSNVSDDDLEAIPDSRIVINVNSMSEIDRCLALDLQNPIALRVNPDVGAGHHVDVVTAGGGVKFGIDVAEVDDARMVVEDSGRKVVGLHAHIGSGIDSIDPLLQSAQRLLELAPDFEHLRWINFGGGIGVPYRPGESEFPIDAYGRELTQMAGRYLRSRGLTAILEPKRGSTPTEERSRLGVAMVGRLDRVRRVRDGEVPLVLADAALRTQLHAGFDAGDRSSSVEQQRHPAGVIDQLAVQGWIAGDG
jgi:diaminopimelate decarboxylase